MPRCEVSTPERASSMQAGCVAAVRLMGERPYSGRLSPERGFRELGFAALLPGAQGPGYGARSPRARAAGAEVPRSAGRRPARGPGADARGPASAGVRGEALEGG